MDQKAYINAMWIMFPNSTLQKHGTGRSGGPGRKADAVFPGCENLGCEVRERDPKNCICERYGRTGEAAVFLVTMRKRNRRNFIKIGVGGAAALLAAPATALLPESYMCDCGLVTYFKQPGGHFSATHFDGQRFTHGLFRMHHDIDIHRRMEAEKIKDVSPNSTR